MEFSQLFRVENNYVLMPTITMQRGKRIVVIMGMTHIASPQFYEEVTNRLQAFEKIGFKVLYEHVDSFLCLSPSSPEEKQFQRCVADKLDELNKRLKVFGLGYQTYYLLPLPHWISADMTGDVLMSRVQSVATANRSQTIFFDEALADPEKFVRKIAAQFINPPRFIKVPTVVVDERDAIASKAILSHAADMNVVTYWGLYHLPGMSKLLADAGFVTKKIEWAPAFNLPRLKAERV